MSFAVHHQLRCCISSRQMTSETSISARNRRLRADSSTTTVTANISSQYLNTLQILPALSVFKYYLNTETLAKHLKTLEKVFKYWDPAGMIFFSNSNIMYHMQYMKLTST